MEWTKALKESIEYIEQNILSDVSLESLSKHVHISPFYFQKAFNIMTGYTIGEYIRNRRLYLAALDLIEKDDKVIEVAYRYGYETPESFSKAFSRFHGLSPMKLRKQPYKIKPFHPMDISVSVRGGTQLDYIVEAMASFKVIGIGKRFSYEKAFDEIPEFWREWKVTCPATISGRTASDFNIGKYGISIDTMKKSHEFDYYIAGDFDKAQVNKDYEVLEIPALNWAKFHCTGPLPTSLQAVNTRIFNEWLPENKAYEISVGYNIEVYHLGDMNDQNYKCEIWIPVKKIN
ncbi:AraC family transcriptional regulator [Anoxynatronum buryatiense]|uniref:AraC family transcriptional regulator n=1 Tax=Anoxynatronum buryatiense TaxID=489973 RepID=A0AA45WWF6_9CLOT|nr:AraC family transcriptional regulator [Anoxynatronum buryatiense]SMP59842.1 AraC family transcriptional regulator [Anoxynatronum buryatiense]